MPGGEIVIHALGKVGVMVDAQPLSGDTTNEYGTSVPALPDAALRVSQNMTHNPNAGHQGALRKRAGLGFFTTTPMGAAILGGISLPVAGTGGAPASGGGNALPGDGSSTGSSSGSASGAGGPGESDGLSGPGAGGAGSGSGSLAPGPGTSGFLRGLYIGRYRSGVPKGWYVASKGFKSVTLLDGSVGGNTPMTGTTLDSVPLPASVVGQTANHSETGSVTEGLCARPNGLLYYPQANDPNGNTNVSRSTGLVAPGTIPNTAFIRRFDGATDVSVAAIPPNALMIFPQVAAVPLTGPISAANTSITVSSNTTFPKTGVVEIAGVDPVTHLRFDYYAEYTKSGSTGLNFNSSLGPAGVTIPNNNPVKVVSHGYQVVSMGTRYADGNTVYICMCDVLDTATPANNVGRIFSLNLGTGELTLVFSSAAGNFAASAAGALPYIQVGGATPNAALVFGQAGENNGGTLTSGVWSLVAGPGWPSGLGTFGGFLNGIVSDVRCLCVFHGSLFVGYANYDGTPAFATLSSINYATNTVTAQLTASGGAVAAGNGFISMAIFQGKLYASFFNPGVAAKIYAFDGSAWTTAYSLINGGAVPLNLQVDNDGDVLYAFGTRQGNTGVFMTSPDGTTWTDQTANMNTSLDAPCNVFGDFR